MKRHLDQRLRLNALRVLDALATNGSLLKASAALGISQPALTKCLRDLEDMLGTRLFERHARGVEATEAGLVMIESGRRILAELKRTEEDLNHLAHGGIAAIGALPLAEAGLLPDLILKVRAQRPQFKLRLEAGRTETLLPLLAAGQIDMVIGRLHPPELPDGFVREELWADPLAIVARADHPLFDSTVLEVHVLAKYELALPRTQPQIQNEIDAVVARLGLDIDPAVRTSSYSFLREILFVTDAFTILPPLLMLGDIRRGAMKVRALPIETPRRPAGVILAPKRKLNAAASAFLDCLREHIDELVELGLAPLTEAPRENARGNRAGS